MENWGFIFRAMRREEGWGGGSAAEPGIRVASCLGGREEEGGEGETMDRTRYSYVSLTAHPAIRCNHIVLWEFCLLFLL